MQHMTVNGSKGPLLPNVEPANSFARSQNHRNDATKTNVSSPAKQSAARVSPLIASLALLASGCAVGPNFVKPAAPDVREYTASPLSTTVSSPNLAGGAAQRFANGGSVSADWWTLFHSKPLDDLIEESLANNHDLKAAQAALLVARENVLAQRGSYYPSVTGGLSAARHKDPAGSLAPVPSTNISLYNLFTAQVSVSYVPDVFGLNRRTVESLQAQQRAARYQMIATYTTLAANVAVTAIQEGAVEMQVDATRRLIDINSKLVQIVQYQFDKGYASGIDLAAQKSQLAQVAATLPPLLKQSAQQRDLLAVLAGR
jgi:NodT family efflux transporter outer membrane factor (OMF) lipoprotein